MDLAAPKFRRLPIPDFPRDPRAPRGSVYLRLGRAVPPWFKYPARICASRAECSVLPKSRLCMALVEKVSPNQLFLSSVRCRRQIPLTTGEERFPSNPVRSLEHVADYFACL